MLARLFHAWERQLAAVDTNRTVRPFEWGDDWLPPATPGVTPTVSSDARVRAWVADALADTPAFFAAPPTRDYTFATAAGESTRPGGESGTLRFPSALATPHPANDTVHARWFPAEGDASLAPHRRGRGRAVVLLPQWNSDADGHVGLARLMARAGISALRLSLPYHDVRMPPELVRADYIVSPNVARTVQACRQAVVDARRAVGWLAELGFERVGILGTSLGSCLAMLTAAHEPRIRAQALNHVSPWFADVVWRGLSTRHVRAGLEGHITLDALRELWAPISPMTHLDRTASTRTLLVYARWDETFPPDLSRMLIDEFRRRGQRPEVRVLPCGHYTTGKAPFKFLDAWWLIRFLRRHL
jgi:pimeloyl-ACP methyl ester carboxylesterase